MSNSQMLPGGFPTPALALVAVDNKSIFGSGSVEDPLRASSGGGGAFKATFVTTGPVAIPGMAVTGSVTAPEPGTDATVTPADATAGGLQAAQVIGLISAVNHDGTVQVQSTGPLTLTAAQWFAAGATAGGLSPTEAYYLSAAGLIDDIAPTAIASYSAQVGVALDALTLELSCPVVPLAVASNVFTRTLVRPNPGQLLHLGNVINVAGQKPIATTDLPTAGSLGLAVALPDATHVTYQFSGIVDLPAATWDVVAGTVGGLVAGDQYYLSNAAAGNLVSVPPVAAGTFQVPIGLALSATEMQLHVGAPVGPHA